MRKSCKYASGSEQINSRQDDYKTGRGGILSRFQISCKSSPVFFPATGLAGFQYGRRSPRVVRVANVDFYGLGGTVFMVNFPSQSVNI